MAYVVTITKETVSQLEDGEFSVSVKVVVTEDAETVLDKVYSKRYNTSVTIDEVETVLVNKIKNDWDEYLAEKGLYDNANFTTLVSNLETMADTYMNS